MSEWQPIETVPLEDVEYAPGCTDKWSSSWLLLGRRDEHGWIEWVGSHEAGMWLERDSRRACGNTDSPTHWAHLPQPPKEKP